MIDKPHRFIKNMMNYNHKNFIFARCDSFGHFSLSSQWREKMADSQNPINIDIDGLISCKCCQTDRRLQLTGNYALFKLVEQHLPFFVYC